MEVPQEHTTNKGFKILEVTREHCLHWGGLGICDSCGEPAAIGKYIAVLNSYYCNDCYTDWHKRAHNYPEDRAYEERHLNDILLRIAF